MAKKKESAEATETVVAEATVTDSKKTAAKPVKWLIEEAAAKRKEKK